MNSTALILAYIGVVFMVGLAGIASAIGTSICGQTAVGAMKKNSGAFGSYMILSALPGSQGLYGFVCFFMVQGLLTSDITMFQAAAVFGAGFQLAGYGSYRSGCRYRELRRGYYLPDYRCYGNPLDWSRYQPLYVGYLFVRSSYAIDLRGVL